MNSNWSGGWLIALALGLVIEIVGAIVYSDKWPLIIGAVITVLWIACGLALDWMDNHG